MTENTHPIKRSESLGDLPNATMNQQDLKLNTHPIQRSPSLNDLSSITTDPGYLELMNKISKLNRQTKSIKFQNQALLCTVALCIVAFITVQAVGIAAFGIGAAAVVGAGAVAAGIGFSAHQVYKHRAEIKQSIEDAASKVKGGVVDAASKIKKGTVHVAENTKNGAVYVAGKATELKKGTCAGAANIALKGAGRYDQIAAKLAKDSDVNFSSQDTINIHKVKKQFEDIFTDKQGNSEKLIRNILSKIKPEIERDLQQNKGWSTWTPEQNKLIKQFIDHPKSLEKLVTKTTELDPIQRIDSSLLNEIFARHHTLFTDTIAKCREEQYASDAAQMFKREAKKANQPDYKSKFVRFFIPDNKEPSTPSQGSGLGTPSGSGTPPTPKKRTLVNQINLEPTTPSPDSGLGRITQAESTGSLNSDTYSINSYYTCDDNVSLTDDNQTQYKTEPSTPSPDTDSLNSYHTCVEFTHDNQTQYKPEPRTPSPDSGLGTPSGSGTPPTPKKRKLDNPIKQEPTTPSQGSGCGKRAIPKGSSNHEYNTDCHTHYNKVINQLDRRAVAEGAVVPKTGAVVPKTEVNQVSVQGAINSKMKKE